jgi:DNA polymerase (family 10)
LREACRLGRVAELPRFGKTLQERLLRAIAEHREEAARLPRPAAAQYAEAILAHIQGAPGIGKAEVAGSFRRRKDTVGDLDILVTARKPEPVIERFLEFPESDQVLAHGPTRAAIRLRSGLQVDLRVLAEESYGAGLYYFTGSKSHNIAVRKLAQSRGLKVNEYGVWRGTRRIAGRTEREVAEAIGLPLIPPELREDRGEVEAALKGTLPRLLEAAEIRGDLQVHTTSSDGRDSLERMAQAAQELGYEYLAITDHTPHLRVTRGLDAAGFRRQRRAIERLNAKLDGLTILAGAEVDILPDGRLDLEDEALRSLDLVVISLHTALALPRRDQTERVLRALRHPAVDILGHPTGRLLGRRAGVDLDLELVFREAATRGVMLEVNAQPDRLDLDDLATQAALSHGVRLAISTDAHAAQELRFMPWGVDQARRGWASAEQVANTRPLAELRRWLHGERSLLRPRAAAAARTGTPVRGSGAGPPATAPARGGPGSGRVRRGRAAHSPGRGDRAAAPRRARRPARPAGRATPPAMR